MQNNFYEAEAEGRPETGVCQQRSANSPSGWNLVNPFDRSADDRGGRKFQRRFETCGGKGDE